MPSDHDIVPCTGCHADIRWAITVNGKRQAINAKPDEAGNLGVYQDGTGTLRARVLTAERPTLEGAEWRAMPHAATCRSPRPQVRRASRPQRRPVVRTAAWRWAR